MFHYCIINGDYFRLKANTKTKPVLPSIFSIISILFYVLVIKFLQLFTNTCSYLKGNKLKNVIPRIHRNAPESIIYAKHSWDPLVSLLYKKFTYFLILEFLNDMSVCS